MTTSIAIIPQTEKKQLFILCSTLKAEAAIAPVAGAAAAASDFPKFRMNRTFSRIVVLREPKSCELLSIGKIQKVLLLHHPASGHGPYRKYPAIYGGKKQE